jgi:hypothetical protein
MEFRRGKLAISLFQKFTVKAYLISLEDMGSLMPTIKFSGQM